MLSDTDLAAALTTQPGERITEDGIKSRINGTEFVRPPMNPTLTLCIITLDNGFSVTGQSACVDPTNYRADIGEDLAYKDAFRKLWSLFGFLLAEQRFHGVSVTVSDAFDFGTALAFLKGGKRVARQGWNGKGMWLVLIHPGNAVHKSAAGGFDMQPCIGMKTAQDTMQPGWLASQADMLAEDWEVVG